MFGSVVVANAYSSDKILSGELYCRKFSYETNSHCMDRGDRWGDLIISR